MKNFSQFQKNRRVFTSQRESNVFNWILVAIMGFSTAVWLVVELSK